jgi:hypothetical protein
LFYGHCNKDHIDEVRVTWLSCPTCQRFFPNKKVLTSHHGNTPICRPDSFVKSCSGSGPGSGSGSGQIGCQFCLKDFGSHKNYYQHCNNEHRFEIYRTWPKCDMCFNHYPTKQVLANHKHSCFKKSNETYRYVSTQAPVTFSTDDFSTSPDNDDSSQVKMNVHF